MPVELPGRAAVTAHLDDALERSGDGLATTVILVGEIGMGRTTVLDRLRGSAQDQDRLVLTATGRAGDSDIGFAGLLSLLRPVEDRIDELAGDRADALQAALSLSPGTTEPGQVRLGLFRLLTGLAAERPLVLILDDAHLLDRSTWDAIRFVLGRVDADQMMAVVSIEPTSELVDDADGQVLLLDPLDDHDMTLLLTDVAPDLAGEVATACVALSSGNPLVAVEMIRSLDDDQRRGLRPLPTMPEPPAALARGFEAALTSVPPHLWPALVAVAADVTGDIDVLLQVLTELDQPPTTLDELERTGFVHLDGRSVQFGHPLLGQFVLYRCSARSRRAAHRALAKALDQPHQQAARAWHLAAAADGPDEEAAAALELVAIDGFNRGGAASAARTYRRAAELSPDPAGRAARLAGALRCWLAVGDVDAVARTTEALEAARQTGAEVDDAIAVGLRWTGGEHRVIAVLEEALGTEADPRRTRRLTALLADAHAAAGDRSEAIAYATEVADGSDAPAALGAAVLALVTDDGTVPDTVEVDDPTSVIGARTRLRLAEALAARGHHRESRAMLRTPEPQHGWDPGEVEAVRARALVMGGEIGAAYELLNRRLDQLPRGADLPRAVLATGLAEIELLMGRSEAAADHLADALPKLQAAGAFADVLRGRRTSARLALASGDADRAVSELSMTVGAAPTYLAVELTAALLALDRGQEAKRLLASATDGTATAADGAEPVLDLAAIRAATTAGLLAGDDDALASVARQAEDLSLPLEAAEIHLHRAEHAFRAGRSSDITVLVAEASARLTAIGVGGWSARLQRLIDAPKAEARRRVADQLTEAEHRVAVTVAVGRTNKEAAAELFLSQKTIDYHLQNIYRKLQIRSRTELAALLAAGE